MNFQLVKGRPFKERFDAKNAQGKVISVPRGRLRLVLERGSFAREYTEGDGLNRSSSTVFWTIPVAESNDFEYTTMYYTLYLDGLELARGVLRIQ